MAKRRSDRSSSDRTRKSVGGSSASGGGQRAKEAGATRRAREAAERLTFLEKLVARALPTRQVPAESGVRFAISSKARDDGVCLIFHVDDPEAPIVEQGPRPDYLVVHASRAGCTITIVEMKGTEEKNVEHGVEQIRAMHQRLRQEMATCLPGSSRRVRIQGLLLTPFNAQVPGKKILDAGKEGLQILPLQYDHQLELYPYVSKPISRTERYAHEKLPRDRPELNVAESLLAEGKLDRRVRDSFFQARRGGDEDTFFASFRRPGDPKDAYVSLSASTKDAVVAFSAAAGERQKEIAAHLEKHALKCSSLRLQRMGATPSSPSASGV